jgi:hypothetical protein
LAHLTISDNHVASPELPRLGLYPPPRRR